MFTVPAAIFASLFVSYVPSPPNRARKGARNAAAAAMAIVLASSVVLHVTRNVETPPPEHQAEREHAAGAGHRHQYRLAYRHRGRPGLRWPAADQRAHPGQATRRGCPRHPAARAEHPGNRDARPAVARLLGHRHPTLGHPRRPSGRSRRQFVAGHPTARRDNGCCIVIGALTLSRHCRTSK